MNSRMDHPLKRSLKIPRVPERSNSLVCLRSSQSKNYRLSDNLVASGPLGILLTCALLLSLSGVYQARAETRPQGFDISLFGGYWEGARNVDSSSYFGFSAGYHISRVFSLEINQGWIPTQAVLTDQFTEANPDRESFTLNQGAVNFLVNLSPHRFVPYLSAGMGWVVTPDESSWVADIGLGAKYYLTHDFALRANLAMWTSDLNLRSEPYDHFTLTFGVSYSIAGDRDIDDDKVINPNDKCPTKPEDIDQFEDDDGCEDKDNDKDGIVDSEDQCPMEPEDEDGDADEDGCPDLDDDRDGIANEEDKCPKVAEDKDGFQDDDGCVDEDNDNDGFNDDQDRCPDEAESINGFQDQDGCPEFDNDKDGIFDSIDRCKSKAENKNGLKDEDGCPDQISAELQALLGLQPQINFKRKRASLKKSRKANERLDMLAAKLKVEPLMVEITATAHRGKDVSALSTERAEMVMRALRERGVPAMQMRAVGKADAELPSDLEASKGQSKKGWISVTPWIDYTAAKKTVTQKEMNSRGKKRVKVKVSKEPKVEKRVKVKVSKEPKVEKTVKVKVSKEPKVEKTVKVKVSKEPKVEKTVKVKVSKKPKVKKTVKVKVSKETKEKKAEEEKK